MATRVQVTFDAADPDRLARFWARALRYEIPVPPEGFSDWAAFLAAQGVPEERWNDASAAEDPEGNGPRLFFQRVPESKAGKNRLHLDLNVGGPRETPPDEREQAVSAEAQRLIDLGASLLERRTNDLGESWTVMLDPEGNEFCLQ